MPLDLARKRQLEADIRSIHSRIYGMSMPPGQAISGETLAAAMAEFARLLLIYLEINDERQQ